MVANPLHTIAGLFTGENVEAHLGPIGDALCGVGSIAIPPATQWFITHHGWRSGYLFLGGIALLGVPLTALAVRNRATMVLPDVPAESMYGLGVGAAFNFGVGIGPIAATDHLIIKGILGRRFDWGKHSVVE